MPSFDEFPTEFADLNEFFPELSSKVGLSHEQVRAIVENIYWNYNHLSQADIEIGTVTVNYAPAGTPFDVEITHSGEYDDHGCLIKDILNFTFTIAVAKVTTTASATLGQTSSDIGAVVTETERQDHTGYDLDFAFTIPRGLQGVQGASFRNKGAYDSTQVYVNNGTYIDFVSYEGSLYAPTVIQTTAGVLPTNTSQWSLMVRRGNGITSITKTSTSGAVDTYTITFEDGTTTTFEVTNGTTPDVSGKADKVANATTGNIATLDANGNLADGGVAPSDLQDTIQYSTMPTASASNVGAIVQYTGATDSTYTSGHFYKCVENSGNYSWEEIEFGGNYGDLTGRIIPDLQYGEFNTTYGLQLKGGKLFYTDSNYGYAHLGQGKIQLGTGSSALVIQQDKIVRNAGGQGLENIPINKIARAVTEMPSNSKQWAYEGAILFYIGNTTNDFIQNHFYTVTLSYATGSAVYEWVDITPSSSVTPVTTISAQSTNADIPSAKAVYDYVQDIVGDIDTALQALNSGGGV